MAKHFKYFDPWRGAPLACSCGWAGALDAKQTEMYEQLLDFECPKCEATLAIISYPTRDDIKHAATRGNDEAERQLDSLRRAQELERKRKKPDS